MLRRFNEWRAEHAQSLEKAKEQGLEQGRAEAYQAIAVEYTPTRSRSQGHTF